MQSEFRYQRPKCCQRFLMTVTKSNSFNFIAGLMQPIHSQISIEKQNTFWYDSTKLTKCLWKAFVKGAVIDNFEPRAAQRTIDQTNRNNLEKEKDLGQRSVLKTFIFLCKRKILTQSRKMMNSKIQAHF